MASNYNIRFPIRFLQQLLCGGGSRHHQLLCGGVVRTSPIVVWGLGPDISNCCVGVGSGHHQLLCGGWVRTSPIVVWGWVRTSPIVVWGWVRTSPIVVWGLGLDITNCCVGVGSGHLQLLCGGWVRTPPIVVWGWVRTSPILDRLYGFKAWNYSYMCFYCSGPDAYDLFFCCLSMYIWLFYEEDIIDLHFLCGNIPNKCGTDIIGSSSLDFYLVIYIYIMA